MKGYSGGEASPPILGYTLPQNPPQDSQMQVSTPRYWNIALCSYKTIERLLKCLWNRLQQKDSLLAWNSLVDCQGAQSKNEDQEYQAEVKELGGTPLAVLRSPGPPGLPSGHGLPGNPSSCPNPSSYPCVEACLEGSWNGLGRPLTSFYRSWLGNSYCTQGGGLSG